MSPFIVLLILLKGSLARVEEEVACLFTLEPSLLKRYVMPAFLFLKQLGIFPDGTESSLCVFVAMVAQRWSRSSLGGRLRSKSEVSLYAKVTRTSFSFTP